MTSTDHRPRRAALAVAALLVTLAARADAPGPALTIVPPGALEWQSVAQLPPEIKVARLVGNPAAVGPYALRVRYPPGSRSLPHSHPDARLVTVLAGEYLFGVGATFDATALQKLPVGTVLLVPAGLAHYSVAGAEAVVIQESGVGPSGVAYLDAADDPSAPRR